MNGPVTAYTHLSDEHRQLLAYAEKLAAQALAPVAAAGRPGSVNRPLLAALAEHGLLPLVFESGV